LVRRWQGEASGIDMLKIYAQYKIVLNDYPDFMQGHSNNLRNMEVFMSGSMLLTRAAANLETVEREGGLVTFDSAASCIAKARHYLAADAEREVIARKGQQLARERFNYRDIA
jgi:spore maturation protein CgeB